MGNIVKRPAARAPRLVTAADHLGGLDVDQTGQASVVEVRAQGEGDLAQLLDLIYFGDYVSLWLAADAGIDPGPVEVLTWLKQQLAGH